MLRMMAACCICRAKRGKYSLMRMAGTEVWISWNGPPCAVPGRRSNVSLWLGPPSIHRRMQDLCLALVSAARLASTLNQPDTEVPKIPAADSLNRSRRESCGVIFRSPFILSLRSAFGSLLRTLNVDRLMVQSKFAGVQEGPEHVAEAGAQVGLPANVINEALPFLGRRPPRQSSDVQLLENLSGFLAFTQNPVQGGGAGELGRIHQPKRLRDAGLVFQRVGAFVDAEEAQEGVARAGRPFAEIVLGALGHVFSGVADNGGQRIVKLLRRKAAHCRMAVKLLVPFVVADRPARALIGLAVADCPVEVFQVEVVGLELLRQLDQQFGMAGEIAFVHVINRVDNAPAEELIPRPVDHGLGEERIAGGGNPLGEDRPIRFLGIELGLLALEELGRHNLGALGE